MNDDINERKYTISNIKRRCKTLFQDYEEEIEINYVPARMSNKSRPESSKMVNDGFNSKGVLFKFYENNFEKKKNQLDLLYEGSEKNTPKIILELKKVSECSIFRYGIKPSLEKIQYSYCITCDKNYIHPICEACIKQCHKGHRIKKNFEKGKIKCACGEKIHNFKSYEKKIANEKCVFSNWISVAKLNNINEKCVCIFCDLICENNNTQKIKDNNNIDCKCINTEIHNDVKKIIEIFFKSFKVNNNLKKLLHPTQIMNMLFKGKESFQYIFSDFFDCFIFKGELINLDIDKISLFLKIDIDHTNIYLTFKLFRLIIIGSELPYYNKELEKYFNINVLKSIIQTIQPNEYNETSYWKFFYEYIFLFDKIYINSNTNFLFKVRIPDLENLSFLQRLLLTDQYNDNINIKKEIKKIISLIRKQIRILEINKINSVETIKYIKNILNILKKLASYNLINIDDMINICIIIELIFDLLSRFRNSSLNMNGNVKNIRDLELKLFNIIVKLLLFFIYYYNDKMINEFLLNKEKYPSEKFINSDNINLLPKKNELGNLINKLNLRILSILNKFYSQKSDNHYLQKIITNSIKILEFSLFNEDNYMKSLIKSIKTLNSTELYHNFSQIKNNKYYFLLIQENSKIEKAYSDYLNFIINIENLERIIDNSLDIVLEDLLIKNKKIENNIDTVNLFFTPEKNLALIKTQYFYKISKLFNIYFFNENILNSNILIKILFFYNIFINNSSDNSILLLSSNMLKFIFNVPRKYSLNIFKLLFKCFANIYIYQGLIININFLIEKIYFFLLKSAVNEINDENNKDQCLFYFLKIIKIIIYDIKIVYNTDNFLFDLKKIIIGVSQNFNLCSKYFDQKMKEATKTKIQSHSRVYQESSNYDLNILSENFLMYFKFINDIFNFSLSEDRRIINRLLNIDLIIYGLSHFILSLGERTEFIRFIRKMTIDVNYCENKEELYASFIINNKDNLSFIKNNKLINDLKYPTRLFSFKKDFYKLSKYVSQNERSNFQKLKIKESNEIIFDYYEHKNIENNKKLNDSFKKSSSLTVDFNNKDREKNIINKNSLKDLSIIEESTFSLSPEKCSTSTNFQCKPSTNNKESKSKFQLLSLDNVNFLKEQNNNNDKKSLNYNTKRRISDFSLKFSPLKQSNKQQKIHSISFNEFINTSANLNNSKFFSDKNTNIKDNTLSSRIIKAIDEDIKTNDIEENGRIKEKDENNDNEQNLNIDNITESYFDEEFYEILNDEIDYFIKCTSNLNLNDKKKEFIEELKYYFENGILLSIISFFERVFVYINLYTGNEIIKIYQLLEKCIKAKIQIFNFNYDFWHEKKEEKTENKYRGSVFKKYKTIKTDIDYKNKKTIFKIENQISFYCFIDEKSKKETIESLEYIKKKDFFIFDYTSLYQIVEKEFLILVKNRKTFNIFELFKKNKFTGESSFQNYDDDFYKHVLDEIILKEEKNVTDYDIKSDIEKKLIKIYLLYKYNKNLIYYKQNEFSLFNILHEVCLEFQNKYENLFLLFLMNNNNLLSVKYYLLFRLLTIMPNEIQSRLIKLVGGTNASNINFMIVFSKKLLSALTLSFIDYFNPSDKILSNNYFVTLSLIKIFKCLCGQYNNFFQHYILKSLTYFYNKIIPEEFSALKTIQSNNKNNNNYNTSLEEEQPILNKNIENEINYSKINIYDLDFIKSEIHFHDFLLCVLIKLLLLSDRFSMKFELLNIKNSYIYDLFESILEMLVILIQGNKMDIVNQNYYRNDEDFFLMKIKLISEENSSSISSNEISSNAIDIGNPYEIFIEKSIDILFGEKTDNNMIDEMYEIKYNLASFLLCILEENNFIESIKKFLITNLNVNKIVSCIGEILKFYYLNQEAKKEKENLIKNNEINNDTKKNMGIKKNISSKNSVEKIINYSPNDDLNINTDIDANSEMALNKQIPPLVFKSKIGKYLIREPSINRCSVLGELKKESDTSLNMNILSNEKYDKKIYSKDDMKLLKEDLNKIIKKIYFDKKLLNYFEKIFYQYYEKSESFIESHEFKLSNIYYKLIKTTSIRKQKKSSVQLIKQTNKIFKKHKNIIHSNEDIKEYIKENYYNKQLDHEENYNSESLKIKGKPTLKSLANVNLKANKKIYINFNITKNKEKQTNLINKEEDVNIKEFIEQFYIIKFFENITNIIEIRTKEKEKYISIFTKVPEFIYLSEDSKINFLNNANRESEKSKKNDLLKNIDYFIDEIQYYKNSKNFVIKWFLKKSFINWNEFGYLLTLVFNLFLLFTIKGDYQITEINSIKYRRKDKLKTDFLIKNSVNYWDKYNSYILSGYVIKNIIIITIIFYSRISIYYRLDKLKYINYYKKKHKKICIKDKLYIFFIMTIFGRKHICNIIYELIITMISVIYDTKILYAFLLLTIFNSVKTIKNVVTGIQLRFKAFFLVLFLSFIFIYIMSNISYFFYKKDYAQDISYNDDNVCDNLIFCFLNALDYGLRARGGIGDSAKSISYLRNFGHYIGRILLDDLYFLLIVIIMIDIVFIVIERSFISLKNKNEKNSLDKKNYCFICHANIYSLKKYYGQSIQKHRTKIHNVWNYVEYIIFLKKSDINKLNYFDTYVLKKIEKKDISWMPTFDDFIREINQKYEAANNGELDIKEENIHKYKLLTV